MLASLLSLFSFAGRSNRAGFLSAALAIGVLQLAGAAGAMLLDGPIRAVADGVLGVLVTTMLAGAIVRRLHDIGRSAWSLVAGVALTLGGAVLAAFVGVALFPLQRLLAASPELGGVLMLALVPPMAMLTWLHAVPGSEDVNRYGPPAVTPPLPGPAAFAPTLEVANDRETSASCLRA